MTDFWLGYIVGAATCIGATGAAALLGWRHIFRRDPIEDYPHGEWPRVPGAGALDNQRDGGRL